MNPDMQPQAKKWPLSHKKTFLLVGGAVLFVILILVVVMTLKSGSDNQSNDAEATFYDRPGYDRTKLGTAFADPFAIKFSPNSKAVDYQGNKVIQACNVLTLDDLTEQGILVKANTIPTPVSRVVNDGIGKAEYPKTTYASSITGKSLGSDVNSCNYVLQHDNDVPMVLINTFQPFSVPDSVVDEEVKKNYMPSGTIEGLELFTKKSSGTNTLGQTESTEYIAIQRDKGAFYLMLELSEDQTAKKQALLETAAKNFVREQANPSGVATLEYDSPVFKKSVISACSLMSNQDIRSLSGRDAGPLAREGIAPSVASLTFPDNQAQQLNVRNECTRSTVGGGSGLGSDGPGDLSLTTETTSFLNDEPAKKAIELSRQPNPNNKDNAELPSQVGDGGVGYTDVSGGHHIIFSKGRVVVDIKLDQRSQQIARANNLQAAVEKLAPIAQSMANKVKE